MSGDAAFTLETDLGSTRWSELDDRIGSLGGTLQQTRSWARYQATFADRRVEGVCTLHEGDRHATLQGTLISQRLPGGYSYLLIPRGPFLREGASPSTLALLRRELRRRFPRALFVRLDPPFVLGTPEAERFNALAQAAGAIPNAHPTTPTTTLLLDLSLGEEQLLAQMHPKGRYNIRVAQKHGVTCRTGSVSDLPLAYPLFRETAERTGISIHPESVYRHMLEELGTYAALELAELGGQLLAAMITTSFGDTATYYYGASSQVRKEAMAPYALQWHAIRRARSDGYRWYDFLGITPEGAGANHPLAGVTDFKRKFGGIVRHEVEPVDLPLRPLLMRGFQIARGLRNALKRR